MNSDHHVQVTLRSVAIQRYLEDAKAQGRAPVSIKEIATVVFDQLSQWCEENCHDEWLLAAMGQPVYWFKSSTDAMLFKLTHI